VMMQPPGSRPGMSSFAMKPMMRPTTNIQMIECAPKSMPGVWSATLIVVNAEMIPAHDRVPDLLLGTMFDHRIMSMIMIMSRKGITARSLALT
jgi:hypothetical protein